MSPAQTGRQSAGCADRRRSGRRLRDQRTVCTLRSLDPRAGGLPSPEPETPRSAFTLLARWPAGFFIFRHHHSCHFHSSNLAALAQQQRHRFQKPASRGANPRRGTFNRSCSSADQSSCLRSSRSQVQFLPGTPMTFCHPRRHALPPPGRRRNDSWRPSGWRPRAGATIKLTLTSIAVHPSI